MSSYSEKVQISDWALSRTYEELMAPQTKSMSSTQPPDHPTTIGDSFESGPLTKADEQLDDREEITSVLSAPDSNGTKPDGTKVLEWIDFGSDVEFGGDGKPLDPEYQRHLIDKNGGKQPVLSW